MSIITVGVVGSKEVGKTQLCSRLVSRRFDVAYTKTPQQTSFYLRQSYKGKDIVFCFEDTEPSEVLRTEVFAQKFWYETTEGGYDDQHEFGKRRRFVPEYNPITSTAKRKRDAIFIVFSLSSRDSFDEARELLSQLMMRLGFNVNGWKTIPITIILVGNKADLVGNSEVTKNEIDDCLKAVTNTTTCHVHYVELSARMGTNVEQLIEVLMTTIPERPSKAQINTPEKTGIWTNLLMNHEWARKVYNSYRETSESAAAAKANVSKFMKPIMSLEWLPKFDYKIPVPERMKVFPNKWWFCFCFRKDKEESDGEDEAFLPPGANVSSDDDDAAAASESE